jgi:hypothetical protein
MEDIPMKRPPSPKPRNPFVQHLMGKKQGAHQKSKKAQRQQDRIKLKKEYQDKLTVSAGFS